MVPSPTWRAADLPHCCTVLDLESILCFSLSYLGSYCTVSSWHTHLPGLLWSNWIAAFNKSAGIPAGILWPHKTALQLTISGGINRALRKHQGYPPTTNMPRNHQAAYSECLGRPRHLRSRQEDLSAHPQISEEMWISANPPWKEATREATTAFLEWLNPPMSWEAERCPHTFSLMMGSS